MWLRISIFLNKSTRPHFGQRDMILHTHTHTSKVCDSDNLFHLVINHPSHQDQNGVITEGNSFGAQNSRSSDTNARLKGNQGSCEDGRIELWETLKPLGKASQLLSQNHSAGSHCIWRSVTGLAGGQESFAGTAADWIKNTGPPMFQRVICRPVPPSPLPSTNTKLRQSPQLPH